jgi:SAM-dependent methyltransferase
VKPLPEGAPHCSYEQSVAWLREQVEYADLVKAAYLDTDNAAAAERFRRESECAETMRLLGLDRRVDLRVLDLGCGNGIAAAAFRSAGHRVVAMDVDLSADVGVRAARRLGDAPGSSPLHAVAGYAEDIPFRDGAFDVVYARQALHHFQDLARGLAECSRVLQAGGLFLAAREHVVSSEQELAAFLKSHPLHAIHGGEHAYPVSTYTDAIAAAGLEILHLYGPYDSPVNQYPTRDDEIRARLAAGLQRRVGATLGSALSRVSFILTLYKKRLSRLCSVPGRLYTFLARKPLRANTHSH